MLHLLRGPWARRTRGKPRPLRGSVRPAAALFVALAGCSAPAARAPAPATDAVTWQYDVSLGIDGNLAVDARFRGPVSGGLTVEAGVERFVDGLAIGEGTELRPASLRDARLGSICVEECRVHYRFRLKEAAAALADVDLALEAGPSLFAPPSTWLVHPVSVPAGRRYRFRVTVPDGLVFATGVRRAATSPSAYEATTDSFEQSSFAAFGPLSIRRIAEPAVDVVIAPGLTLSDEAVVRWAKTEFDLVAGYVRRPPSDALSVFVLPGTQAVTRGKTLGGGGSSIFLRVGTGVSEATLMDDWVLCHELIHVAFPSIDGGAPWFSEGLASYTEPVIRAGAGLVTKEKFWGDLVEGLPQGLPGRGDKGLETDDSWGRVYWGGALYFLLADLAVRERTSETRSLEDAVAAIVKDGGNVEAREPLRRILETGDRATGTPVLEELYDRFARAPGTVDLETLWSRLGVVHDGKTVRFDDRAPAAALRDSVPAARSHG